MVMKMCIPSRKIDDWRNLHHLRSLRFAVNGVVEALRRVGWMKVKSESAAMLGLLAGAGRLASGRRSNERPSRDHLSQKGSR